MKRRNKRRKTRRKMRKRQKEKGRRGGRGQRGGGREGRGEERGRILNLLIILRKTQPNREGMPQCPHWQSCVYFRRPQDCPFLLIIKFCSVNPKVNAFLYSKFCLNIRRYLTDCIMKTWSKIYDHKMSDRKHNHNLHFQRNILSLVLWSISTRLAPDSWSTRWLSMFLTAFEQGT